ncbi:MAG: pyrroline-5-carboxylate reductase [Deltaproteobacteria bacterium]|nr:MAG: pyrroline-5-carboxylate reductase [Deltaproteobacteria bacterium]
MDIPWTLGFIGAGVMADVMIGGLLAEEVLPPDHIIASDPNRTRLQQVHVTHGVRTLSDNRALVEQCDVVILAVKPQNLAEVMAELAGRLPEHTTVMSIVAGATIGVIRRGLRHEHVVRCMPNLPCRIRRGMTVWTAAGDRADLARVRTILRVMGEEIFVDHEEQVDQATAVNGTGPAIVAHFVKSMVEAATYIGEPRQVARDTVLATLIGTAEMIRVADRDGIHVAQLIDDVTSPGGTTSRAIQVLKRGRFSAVVTESIEAAHARTLQLGEELERALAAAGADGSR